MSSCQLYDCTAFLPGLAEKPPFSCNVPSTSSRETFRGFVKAPGEQQVVLFTGQSTRNGGRNESQQRHLEANQCNITLLASLFHRSQHLLDTDMQVKLLKCFAFLRVVERWLNEVSFCTRTSTARKPNASKYLHRHRVHICSEQMNVKLPQ